MSGLYVVILAGLGTTSGSDVWVYRMCVHISICIYIYIERLQRENTGPS